MSLKNPARVKTAFILLVLLAGFAAPASAVISEFSILLNTDASPVSGCDVTTADGVFPGVEHILITTVDTTGASSAQVIRIERQECVTPVTDTFGPRILVDETDRPVGVGLGLDGFNVVETYFPLSALPVGPPNGPGVVRFGVTSLNGTGGQDALLTVSPVGNQPIQLILAALSPTNVPTLSEWGLILLGLLLATAALVILRRRSATALLAALVLFTGAGIAWAAASDLDGNTLAEWGAPLANDTAGDAPVGADIRAFFAMEDGPTNRVYFRLDVSLEFDSAPTVTSTVPADVATGVAVSSNITVNFSENVNVTASAFSLECPVGAPVAFTVTPAPPGGTNSFTLDPTTDLPAGVTCTVTVNASQVTDTDANDPPDTMAVNHTFSFTTDGAPTVTSTTPANGATAVAANSNVVINFSENVNVTASAFTLECPVGSPVAFTLSPAAPGGTNSFTLDPAADLPAGVVCTVRVVATQVTDTDANDPPDQMAADHVFNFTVDGAPAVASTTPADGATGVAANANITVNFTKPVNVTASAFTLECPVGSAVAFTLSPAVPGGVSSFTLDPTADLPAGVTCTVTVVATEVTDTDANDPPDQMAANYVFTFTTDAAPSVTTTTPTAGATGVAPDANITINFSETVNVTASAFTLECPVGSPVAFTLSPAAPGGVNSFTLDPVTDLPAGVVCTVTVVATEVTDTDANDPPNQMAANYVFTFTADEAPFVTATTPADNAINVAANTDLTITFSENVDVIGNWFQIVCPTSGTRNIADTGVTGGPGTFTINPNADFASGETCSVTVFAAQVTDQDANDPPDQMAANYTFDFTMDAAPAVFATFPIAGATNVSTSSNLTIDFTEPVNVAGNWFQIVCGASGTRNVADTVVSGGPTSFSINPNTDFTSGESCTVTVFAAQVMDQDGNDPPDTMLANHVFSFTMDLPPSVNSTSPADGSTTAATNTDLTINFSEPVTAAGSWFQIVCATSGTRNVADTVVTGGPMSFTINPNVDFAAGESCTVTVSAAQVSDLDVSDPPDTMVANYVFTYTTDSAPSVTATVPADGALGAAPDDDLSITFSEAVNVTGNWFQIVCSVTGTRNVVDTVVSGGPTTFTINPNVDFVGNESCTVTVFAAQVADQDGNDPPDNMAANYVFTYATDAAPTVIATTPAGGAVDQATNTNLSVTFSEPVNVTANWFQIVCTGSGTRNVGDTVVLGGPTTFTIDPAVDFAPAESCTVTVFGAQVADQDANDPPDTMAANYMFTYTTDAQPAVTATTPADGAVDQPANTDLTVTFSEPVNVTGNWIQIVCTVSGTRLTAATVVTGGPTTYTVNPNVDFTPGESCTATVFAAQVSDQDANDPPDNPLANFMWTFSIDAAPSVTATTPVNAATQVATNTNLSVTFSEPVNVAGNWFQLVCATSGTRNAADTIVSGGPTTFTINPNVDLSPNESCTLTVFAAQVSDQDANDPPNNMEMNFSSSFTTDAAPSVTSTVPTNGATGVAPTTTITVNFSESVNATISSFSIECPVGSAQTFTLSASPSATFTLTPTSNLPAGTVCTITVFAAQVTDADAGDPPDTMLANHVFTFSVPPVAVNDNYAPNIIGNVGVNTANSTSFSILTNDTPNGGMTITTSGVSAQGGTVSVIPSGTFTYIPPAGYEGADSFTYTISNISGTSAPATVSLNVAGMIWFINNNAVPGDGRLSSPLNSLAGFQAINNGAGNNPAAGDNVFLYQSSTAYTGPVTLLGNQKLIGQDATTTLAAIAGVTVPLDSFPLPAMNSLDAIASTVSISSAGINAVNLNNVSAGNTVRGLTITTGTASSVGVNGSSFGAFSTGDISVTGNGPALNLTTGSVSGTINSVSSSGSSTQGINLSGLTGGSLTIGTTSVTNSTGVGINVQSSAATLSFGNTTVSKGATAGVGVQLGSNSGPITFTTLSSTTSSGSGLVGTNNSGAINVTTAAGSSIVATGGAAIDITNAAGNPPVNLNFTTLTTTNSPVNAINLDRVGGTGLTVTGATALDMAAGSGNVIDLTNLATTTIAISNASTVTVNDRRATGIFIDTAGGTVGFGTTTIPNPNGAGGYGIRVEDSSAAVTFASATISNTVRTVAKTYESVRDTPTNDGDGDGIFLKNTTGSFTLNGGTIQNTDGHGIDLRSASNITIDGVTLNLNDGGGIQGHVVTNFALSDCNITNFGDDIDNDATANEISDSALRFRDLAGTATIQRCNIDTSTGFALTQFPAAPMNNGLEIFNRGVNLTITVTGTDFDSIANNGIEASGESGTLNVIVDSDLNNDNVIDADGQNTFTMINGFAVRAFSEALSGTVALTADRNLFNNIGVAVWFAPGAGGSTNVVVRNNTITNTVTHAIMQRTALSDALTVSTAHATISGNTMSGIGTFDAAFGGRAVDIEAEDSSLSRFLISGNNITLGVNQAEGMRALVRRQANSHIVVTGNTMTGSDFDGIRIQVQNGSGAGAGSSTGCVHLSGNTVDDDGAGGFFDYLLAQQNTSTVQLQGFGGGAGADTFIDTNNPGVDDVSAIGTIGAGPGGGCLLPP